MKYSEKELWDCLVRHATVGFESGPGWNTTITIPTVNSDSDSITEAVVALLELEKVIE